MTRKTLIIRAAILLLAALALVEGLSLARAPVPPPVEANATGR